MRGWLWAAVGLVAAAGPAAAQQNLFNVPSGQITKRGEAFFQQQFNLSGSGESNTTLDFGLGHGFELGVNYLDQTFYGPRPPYPPGGRGQLNPDLLLNGQYGRQVTDNWDFGVGTQIGVNPTRQARDARLLNFTWAVNKFDLFDEKLTLYAGGYYANLAYAGPGERGGLLLGLEVPVVKEKFHFQADLIGGRNEIAVGVIGGVVFLPRNWQLSFGGQVPAPRSGNGYGAVVELTQTGFDLSRLRRRR